MATPQKHKGSAFAPLLNLGRFESLRYPFILSFVSTFTSPTSLTTTARQG